jgi:hypothetical protein
MPKANSLKHPFCATGKITSRNFVYVSYSLRKASSFLSCFKKETTTTYFSQVVTLHEQTQHSTSCVTRKGVTFRSQFNLSTFIEVYLLKDSSSYEHYVEQHKYFSYPVF